MKQQIVGPIGFDIFGAVIHVTVAASCAIMFFAGYDPSIVVLIPLSIYSGCMAAISFGITPFQRVENVEEAEWEDKTDAVTKILRNPAYSKSARVEAGLDLTQSPHRYPYTIKGEIARKKK